MWWQKLHGQRQLRIRQCVQALERVLQPVLAAGDGVSLSHTVHAVRWPNLPHHIIRGQLGIASTAL